MLTRSTPSALAVVGALAALMAFARSKLPRSPPRSPASQGQAGGSVRATGQDALAVAP